MGHMINSSGTQVIHLKSFLNCPYLDNLDDPQESTGRSIHLRYILYKKENIYSILYQRNFYIMEDQYALKPSLWQTSLFRLQNVKLMMKTYNNLLMLETSR